MRFLDVGFKKIDEFKEYATKVFEVSDVDELLSRKASEAGEAIRKLMECPAMNQPVLYNVELGNCKDIEDFEIMCNLITTCVINNNSRGGKEHEHITKLIPEQLEEVNCTVLPLIKAINVDNINSVYNIYIHTVGKSSESFEFYLVGETPSNE